MTVRFQWRTFEPHCIRAIGLGPISPSIERSFRAGGRNSTPLAAIDRFIDIVGRIEQSS